MSAERRLMDLLAGWAAYIDLCHESNDDADTTHKDVYAQELDAVYDLYQKTASVDGLSAERIDTLLEAACRVVRTGHE